MEPLTVTVRELRNNGGAVLRRVRDGETLVVTLDGEPVAELRPLPALGTPVAALLEAWRAVPPVDAACFRRDLDAALDSRLFAS